ncbi:hypothetical protein IE53DRAFT_378487 [Violaceomyces palustris]|uniref:Uncharacterized protein n=1 Tax=Violaceomyces palustris TaxID=1673888 RepID=A0ACD0P1U3_9BASI|nr:hypothetical protein IE53DRAFT_378487 [Violaceomyces palustris]
MLLIPEQHRVRGRVQKNHFKVPNRILVENGQMDFSDFPAPSFKDKHLLRASLRAIFQRHSILRSRLESTVCMHPGTPKHRHICGVAEPCRFRKLDIERWPSEITNKAATTSHSSLLDHYELEAVMAYYVFVEKRLFPSGRFQEWRLLQTSRRSTSADPLFHMRAFLLAFVGKNWKYGLGGWNMQDLKSLGYQSQIKILSDWMRKVLHERSRVAMARGRSRDLWRSGETDTPVDSDEELNLDGRHAGRAESMDKPTSGSGPFEKVEIKVKLEPLGDEAAVWQEQGDACSGKAKGDALSACLNRLWPPWHYEGGQALRDSNAPLMSRPVKVGIDRFITRTKANPRMRIVEKEGYKVAAGSRRLKHCDFAGQNTILEGGDIGSQNSGCPIQKPASVALGVEGSLNPFPLPFGSVDLHCTPGVETSAGHTKSSSGYVMTDNFSDGDSGPEEIPSRVSRRRRRIRQGKLNLSAFPARPDVGLRTKVELVEADGDAPPEELPTMVLRPKRAARSWRNGRSVKPSLAAESQTSSSYGLYPRKGLGPTTDHGIVSIDCN